ncbi:hypothetical protein WJX72_005545 [[Myrmecia] bisecta]|uniref:1-(5-phosphoribosyl)-5-[(5-phosphoribosylamino)methylideneamino] imidazole-4-carboxamide isomerase HISN3, chloroplastic n=1 Tax=[Myrmecia] bisecta TaxID=41462 RepID=A0AAW1QF47_9CHLO
MAASGTVFAPQTLRFRCQGHAPNPRQAPACSVYAALGREASATQQNERAIQFRPCIDIHKGKVKQIVGSTLQDSPSTSGRSEAGATQLITNFESEMSAAFYAELYKQDELRGGHVIMLGADPDSRLAAFEALMAYPGGLQVGGGITADNAAEHIAAGASHVIVTSYVFRDGRLEEDRLKSLVQLIGRERLVLDLSCRRRGEHYYVVTDRWQKFSELALSERTLAELAQSCNEFLVHGVDVEGKQLGIDDELVQLLGQWSPIPVTYAGGARTLEDLERVRVAGNGRVDITVGSALDIFGGQLPYHDVVDWHWQQQGSARCHLPSAKWSSGSLQGRQQV